MDYLQVGRMQYAQLGRAGMRVSRLCLGTANFVQFIDEKECFRIMDAALAAGINYFDTANEYGGEHKGFAETMIGRWFKQNNTRHKVILQTKSFSWMADSDDPANEGEHGFSTYKARRDLEGSFRRLGTDHIEVYMMHQFDVNATVEEMVDCFQSMFMQGKIDYWAASNTSAHNLMEVQAEAKRHNFLGLVGEESKYNLMYRLPELELLPTVQKLGIGFLPYSPLNVGLLSGKKASGERAKFMAQWDAGNRKVDYLSVIDMEKRLEQYDDLCSQLGYSSACVAYAWLLANPAVTSPILGPRTAEQLEAILPALEIKLTEDVLRRLDEIFPGPIRKSDIILNR